MSSNPLAASYSPIPQFDLAAQFAVIGGEIHDAVERVLSSQQFILGREGAALEEEVAALCGAGPGSCSQCCTAGQCCLPILDARQQGSRDVIAQWHPQFHAAKCRRVFSAR